MQQHSLNEKKLKYLAETPKILEALQNEVTKKIIIRIKTTTSFIYYM